MIVQGVDGFRPPVRTCGGAATPVVPMTDPRWRALSLRNPWPDAILRPYLEGGKRVENRLKWKGSGFRGEFLIHASQGADDPGAKKFMGAIPGLRAADLEWNPPPANMGGWIVGIAEVVDVIMPGGFQHAGTGRKPSEAGTLLHRMRFDRWYMGGFALILDHVRRCEPVKWKGSLSFFRVPDHIAAAALKTAKNVEKASDPGAVLGNKMIVDAVSRGSSWPGGYW